MHNSSRKEVAMAGGFAGRYCIVDLNKGTTEVVEPGEQFYKKFLCGYGLGAAVITMRQKPAIDALSQDSYLGFCTGVLTGTGAPFSGRLSVVGKSPLTGGWGDANAGGFFAHELKRTGYDALFFTGAAKKPVWVFITSEEIEIKDASSLWGKDTVETEQAIRHELGDSTVQVAAIGMSGEKRSRISGIVVNGGRIAARSGLGAVMGSKNLKAVAVSGDQEVPVAQPDMVRAINKKFGEDYAKSKTTDKLIIRYSNLLARMSARSGISLPVKPSTTREILKRYGTAGPTAYYALIGETPIKNWGGVTQLDYSIASALKISDDSVLRYQKRRFACQDCPLGCGGIIDIHKGRYRGTEGHKPEYETLAAFGGLLLHDDLDAIIEINEMCNRAGIDTISTGASVAFAIECFKNGLIDDKVTGGLNLDWGKTEEIARLTEMIINRHGFGDLLADGVKRAAQKIGRGSEKFAMHAGGQELPMHDSRFDQGFAIAYQCEPTPARHTISSYLFANLFGVKHAFPEARRMIKRAKGKQAKNVRLYTAGSFYAQLINCSGMCILGALTISVPVVAYLNAVTGWQLSADEYLRIGERILNLRKAFTVREGVKPEDQKLSDRAIGKPPLSKGPLKNVTVDVASLTREFYETVGWDPATGGPTNEKMKELEINSLFS